MELEKTGPVMSSTAGGSRRNDGGFLFGSLSNIRL